MMTELTQQEMMETDGGGLRDWLETIAIGVAFVGAIVIGGLIGDAVDQAV